MSTTTKILNVAEKNDAARELSRIMSRGRAQRVSERDVVTSCSKRSSTHHHSPTTCSC